MVPQRPTEPQRQSRESQTSTTKRQGVYIRFLRKRAMGQGVLGGIKAEIRETVLPSELHFESQAPQRQIAAKPTNLTVLNPGARMTVRWDLVRSESGKKWRFKESHCDLATLSNRHREPQATFLGLRECRTHWQSLSHCRAGCRQLQPIPSGYSCWRTC